MKKEEYSNQSLEEDHSGKFSKPLRVEVLAKWSNLREEEGLRLVDVEIPLGIVIAVRLPPDLEEQDIVGYLQNSDTFKKQAEKEIWDYHPPVEFQVSLNIPGR